MYSNNPITSPIPLPTGPRSITLRQPWRTIPDTGTRCMHAFIKTSNQLRLKVRNATLRDLHHTSLYRCLILKAKAQGARTNTIGTAIHSHIRKLPKDGITLLKFIYGQLNNGKLACIHINYCPPMHSRYVDCRTHAHTSRENAKPATTNSSASTTQLAISPTQPLEPRSKTGVLFTHHTTLY
jgi:hypothetical protein